MSEVRVHRIHPEYKAEEKLPQPAQYNLFTGELEVVPIIIGEQQEGEIKIDEGITMVKTGDISQIIVSGYGIFLSKKSERLLVRKGKEVIYQFPLFRLKDVIIVSKGVTISTDMIEELCLRGISIHFLSGNNKPYAMITSPMLTATIEARREQFEAIKDHRGLEFSKAIVYGKITNQERLLRYFGKYIKETDPERFRIIESITKDLRELRGKVKKVTGKHVDEKRNTLIGIEGTAGRLYWDGVKEILMQRIEFFGRQTRSAIDPVNSLLNYGYGILYSTIWGALVNAGLEPFAGFLHVDRPGKPSLVLDLIEEFRQPVVDRVVIAHVNLGQDIKIIDGMLDADTRKIIGEKILGRLESIETYKGKKYQIRSIIQMQARNLASFLRGQQEYKPFTFKW